MANCCVQKIGNFTKDTKVTVVLGIKAGDPDLRSDVKGSVERPRKFLKVLLRAGTSADDFFKFIDKKVIQRLHPKEKGPVFMWDNLNLHMSRAVYDLIENAGHEAICRPLWCPADGSIEYVFNQIGVELQKYAGKVKTLEKLMEKIKLIVQNLPPFDSLFKKLGY